ncbi:MAG TPA: TIGR04255 family protein [Methanoregulaceae archaeon]|nr:TIGR04255 family protein [Methanoregulaceae archaeon]
MCTSGAEARSLTIPPPYPGWPHIREKIKDMVMAAGEISHINGCLLRYSDLIPFSDGKKLPGTEEIAHLISGIYQCSSDSTQNEIILIDTKIPDTIGSVHSIQDSPGKPGWTLIFTMNTERPVRFDSISSILNWFDDARAGIHEIFDLIVPEEIVQALK